MANTRRQEGDVISYANAGAAIASGDPVVMGAIVGIAQVDIASGETGPVMIADVHLVPKATGRAWTQGEKLDFDVSAEKFDKLVHSYTGDCTGCAIAWKAAGSGDTTGEVLLTPGTGTAI